MKEYDAQQVVNGTWGEVWYDGEYLAEIIAGKAELSYKKTEIQQACKMTAGQKITGVEGKGEIKFYHVNSRVMKKELDAVKAGKTAVHTIIMKVADPDAIGSEKISLSNCVLDKITLADFEVNKMGERTCAFSFEACEFLESMGTEGK